MKWALRQRGNYSRKHLMHYSKKIITFKFARLFGLLGCSLCILFSNSQIAIEATSTYYNNNNLTVTGRLIYVSSTYGTPVDNLADGSQHTIYLNKEAERSIVTDPYLSNLSTNNIQGWIEDGYEISLPYSQMLAVTQPHNYGNGTRNATAYYEVEVEEINTILLYKSFFGTDYTVIFISGICILIISALFKRLTS